MRVDTMAFHSLEPSLVLPLQASLLCFQNGSAYHSAMLRVASRSSRPLGDRSDPFHRHPEGGCVSE